jgi:hypothetical protein
MSTFKEPPQPPAQPFPSHQAPVEMRDPEHAAIIAELAAIESALSWRIARVESRMMASLDLMASPSTRSAGVTHGAIGGVAAAAVTILAWLAERWLAG